MLKIPPEAKEWVQDKTRTLEKLMLKAGISIAAVSLPWQAEYACICLRALSELMQDYGASIGMKEGEASIRIDSGKDFYWSCKESCLVDALILAYETVLERKPRKKVGHG